LKKKKEKKTETVQLMPPDKLHLVYETAYVFIFLLLCQLIASSYDNVCLSACLLSLCLSMNLIYFRHLLWVAIKIVDAFVYFLIGFRDWFKLYSCWNCL